LDDIVPFPHLFVVGVLLVYTYVEDAVEDYLDLVLRSVHYNKKKELWMVVVGLVVVAEVVVTYCCYLAFFAKFTK
jgi:hypothetical protein